MNWKVHALPRSGNHMRLSGMADNKAHILLSINSIIISVLLTLLIKNLQGKAFLIAPTALLLAVCLVTIVFAVLATKPKVSKGVFTTDQVRKHEVNLLFFGNFHNMSWDTYEWGILVAPVVFFVFKVNYTSGFGALAAKEQHQ